MIAFLSPTQSTGNMSPSIGRRMLGQLNWTIAYYISRDSECPRKYSIHFEIKVLKFQSYKWIMIVFKLVFLNLLPQKHTSMHVHITSPKISEDPRTSCGSCVYFKLKASDLNKCRITSWSKTKGVWYRTQGCFEGRLALTRSWTWNKCTEAMLDT